MTRSRLLTHWTGKDICTDPAAIDGRIRQQYTRRLESLISGGFWMGLPLEELRSQGEEGTSIVIKYEAPMTCFTELRPTEAEPHSSLYGLLGIVVDRQFVLERWGAPVHYVRSFRDDAITQNMQMIEAWFWKQEKDEIADAETIRENLRFLVGYMKGMSGSEEEDFRYLEEHEWRVVHSHTQERKGRIVATGKEKPKYLIPFTRDDVQMLIVPDSQFRDELLCSPLFAEWKGAKHLPMLTNEDLRHL